jgi:Family of unknown function (DUF6441)
MFKIELNADSALKAADQQARMLLRGALNLVRDEARGLEQDLEKITQLAVPGKLYRGWQSQSLKRIARNPSAWVYFSGGSRSRGAITYFTQPGRLSAKSGRWLAIPTPAAGPRGRKRDLSPEEWERQTGRHLRFVYRAGKPGLLVLDNARLSKKGFGHHPRRQIRAGKESRITSVIFVLIPYQDFANAFSTGPIVERRRANLDNALARHIRAALGNA